MFGWNCILRRKEKNIYIKVISQAILQSISYTLNCQIRNYVKIHRRSNKRNKFDKGTTMRKILIFNFLYNSIMNTDAKYLNKQSLLVSVEKETSINLQEKRKKQKLHAA